jgi:hypothetical protein
MVAKRATTVPKAEQLLYGLPYISLRIEADSRNMQVWLGK